MRRRAGRLLLSLAIMITGVLVAAGPVLAAPANAPQQQSGGVHVVHAGETLSGIARQYGVSAPAMVEANGLQNENFIYVGQRLVVPGMGASNVASSSSTGVHVVAQGESLGSIAAQYGSTVAALTQANGIGDPNLVYVGQRLTIPGAGTPAAAPPPLPASGDASGRWIDINLSTQTLTAYEGSRALLSTAVSTGLPDTPTPEGAYSIGYKTQSQRMTGPDYDLANVPWVMYFTNRGHAIHGAYWHNNFGTPMSHGCVNTSVADAQWLYDFAPKGTRVVVHY